MNNIIVKTHNQLLNETIQKLAFSFGYAWVEHGQIPMYLDDDKNVLFLNVTTKHISFSDENWLNEEFTNYNDDVIFSAKKDWDLIEGLLKLSQTKKINLNDIEDLNLIKLKIQQSISKCRENLKY